MRKEIGRWRFGWGRDIPRDLPNMFYAALMRRDAESVDRVVLGDAEVFFFALSWRWLPRVTWRFVGDPFYSYEVFEGGYDAARWTGRGSEVKGINWPNAGSLRIGGKYFSWWVKDKGDWSWL